MRLPHGQELDVIVLVIIVFLVTTVVFIIARIFQRSSFERKCAKFGLHPSVLKPSWKRKSMFCVGVWQGARVVVEWRAVTRLPDIWVFMDVGELPLRSYREVAASSQAWLGNKASLCRYQDYENVYNVFANDGPLDWRGMFFADCLVNGYAGEIRQSLENMYAFREEIRRQCLPRR